MAADPVAGNYHYFLPITTRWMDNDVYGHVNNVTYYSYFDTVANHFLITEGGLDIHHSPVIALVVEFTGLAAANIYVTDTEAVAHGQFVHVFVDRETRRAVAIPAQVRAALETLVQS